MVLVVRLKVLWLISEFVGLLVLFCVVCFVILFAVRWVLIWCLCWVVCGLIDLCFVFLLVWWLELVVLGWVFGFAYLFGLNGYFG